MVKANLDLPQSLLLHSQILIDNESVDKKFLHSSLTPELSIVDKKKSHVRQWTFGAIRSSQVGPVSFNNNNNNTSNNFGYAMKRIIGNGSCHRAYWQNLASRDICLPLTYRWRSQSPGRPSLIRCGWVLWWTGIFCYLVLTVTPLPHPSQGFVTRFRWRDQSLTWAKAVYIGNAIFLGRFRLCPFNHDVVEKYGVSRSWCARFSWVSRGTGGWGLKNVGWFTVQSNCGKMQIPFWLLNATEGVAPQIMTHCRCAAMTVSFFKKRKGEAWLDMVPARVTDPNVIAMCATQYYLPTFWWQSLATRKKASPHTVAFAL